MAIGRLLKDRQLSAGSLPINLLERSPLSPMARLCWGILDSCGADLLFPSLATIAFRMGLKPDNRKSVIRWLDELEKYGFLEKHAKFGESTEYYLTMPDYCWVHDWSKFSTEIHKAHSERPQATGKRRQAPKVSFDRMQWLEAVEGRREARIKGRRLAKKEKAKTSGPRATPTGSSTSGPRATPPEAHGPHPLRPTGHTTVEVTVESKGESAPPKTASKTDREWPEIFEAVTTKTWDWTPESQAEWAKILKKVPESTARGIMLLKFARDKFWQKAGCPLDKFLKNFNQYSLDRLEKMSLCKHTDFKLRTYTNENGTFQEQICKGCPQKSTVLILKAARPENVDLSSHDPRTVEKYRAAEAAGATEDELGTILMQQF